MDVEQINIAKRYFSTKYQVVAHYPFATCAKVNLIDHKTAQDRRCRFCRRGSPETSFSAIAHAIPEFLGNRDVISKNECNECNEFFAKNVEDHLGKWSLFSRATIGISGKKNPVFKNRDGSLRVEYGANGPNIILGKDDPVLQEKLRSATEPFEYKIPVPGKSQPYVPLRAAQTLIKIACSICPVEELSQCEGAINWIRHPNNATLKPFLVFEAFTPGSISKSASEVILLRRKIAEPVPYFWIVLQYKNFRLQTFVPFCPNDSAWLSQDQESRLDFAYWPGRFGKNWAMGETVYRNSDWSGTELLTASPLISFQFLGPAPSQAQ